MREHGIAILRDRGVCANLQAGMSRAFHRPDLFPSNDAAPLWDTIFNAVDEHGAPSCGDGQRMQLHPDHAPAFTKCSDSKDVLRDLLLVLSGENISSASVSVRAQREGLDIRFKDTGFYVSATILRGKDPNSNMAPQPWHCDHARHGEYSGHQDFPFVVVFPLRRGDCYRCNVLLPEAQLMGEISLLEDAILFLRGDTIHGGAANFFSDRVHLYVEKNTLPRREADTTFLVSDETLSSLFQDAHYLKQQPEG